MQGDFLGIGPEIVKSEVLKGVRQFFHSYQSLYSVENFKDVLLANLCDKFESAKLFSANFHESDKISAIFY